MVVKIPNRTYWINERIRKDVRTFVILEVYANGHFGDLRKQVWIGPGYEKRLLKARTKLVSVMSALGFEYREPKLGEES